MKGWFTRSLMAALASAWCAAASAALPDAIEAAVAAMEHGLSECPGMGEAETLAILEVLGVG